MTTDEQRELSHLNLAEYRREVTRWNASGEIFENNDLLLTLGGGEFPTTNVAMRLDQLPGASARDSFERIKSFYGERRLPFSIHLQKPAEENLENICKSERMVPVYEVPGMIATRPLDLVDRPALLDMRTINTVEGARDFAWVVSQSYSTLGMPLKISEFIFSTPERILHPYNHIVVAYLEKKPLSAAMIILSHGIAGIYWVGTLEAARRKGLAQICVGSVMNEAFRRGAAFVTLQATPFGEPLYRRLGFTEITRYSWYMTTEHKFLAR